MTTLLEREVRVELSPQEQAIAAEAREEAIAAARKAAEPAMRELNAIVRASQIVNVFSLGSKKRIQSADQMQQLDMINLFPETGTVERDYFMSFPYNGKAAEVLAVQDTVIRNLGHHDADQIEAAVVDVLGTMAGSETDREALEVAGRASDAARNFDFVKGRIAFPKLCNMVMARSMDQNIQ